MSLTYGEAKRILSQYAGKGGKIPTDKSLDLFVRKVLQYLLISGSPNSERVFELYAINNYFTAPYELQTPLKVKINGSVGNVVNKWFEFRAGDSFSERGCYDASHTVFEDPNEYYTAYDIPVDGAQLGILGTVQEDDCAEIIISGNDPTGLEIFTNHKGAEIDGELLTIRKGVITWTNVTFGKITGISKTRTKGYTPLYWRKGNIKGFLSDYSPAETEPSYRRYRIDIKECPPNAKIEVLGRVRIKETYSDNDRIPFDNIATLELAGQQQNSQYNKELDAASAQDTFLQSLVNREAQHKKINNGNPLEFEYITSAGAIKGIV